MPLFLNNTDQAKSITATEAIAVLEDGIRQLARGDAIRRPRIDNLIPTDRPGQFFSFSSMEGGIRYPGFYALRIKPDILSWPKEGGLTRRVTYCTRPGVYGGLVFLFQVDNAELLAIMNDGIVQHYRVGANAALGVRYLARPEARVLAIIGSGGMARSYAEGICAVRQISTLKVYSPNREHVDEYIREMSPRLPCDLVPVGSARQAVQGADIVASCTNSMAPVIAGEWLEPGMHIANCMSWELGPDVCARIDTAGLLLQRAAPRVAGFVDDDFAVRMNVMSYAAGRPEERAQIPISSRAAQGIPAGVDRYPNARFVDCVDWDTGETYRRRPEEITTLANASFGTREGDMGSSAGIQGVQFATVGGRIYENARRQGLGTSFPLDIFLQDIPT